MITAGKMALPVAVTVILMLGALLCTPDGIGRALLQDTWPLVAMILVPGAINRFFAGLSIIPTVLLRVQGVTWKATIIRIIVLTSSVALGPVGALLAGAGGALAAEAASYGLATVALTVLSLKSAQRSKEATASSPASIANGH